MLSLHQQLDAAVPLACAWPAALPAAEVPPHLVRLHHEHARGEAGGHVRYLRPVYQALSQQQAAVVIVIATTTGTSPQAWPTGLAQQLQVAAAFWRVRPINSKPIFKQRLASVRPS